MPTDSINIATAAKQSFRSAAVAALFTLPLGIIPAILSLISTIRYNKTNHTLFVIENIAWTIFLIIFFVIQVFSAYMSLRPLKKKAWLVGLTNSLIVPIIIIFIGFFRSYTVTHSSLNDDLVILYWAYIFFFVALGLPQLVGGIIATMIYKKEIKNAEPNLI